MMLRFSTAGAARLEQAAAWLALVVVATSVWWFNTAHLAARLAWDGFSPTQLVAQYLHPQWFVGDFPSGTAELLKSAPMAIYLLADKFGIWAVTTMKGLIGAEILLLAGASLWFARRIRPQTQWTSAILVAVFVISGSMRMANLGRFGDPGYGWVYNYAFAAVIVGTAAALEQRLLLSAVSFALAFVCHPVLGLLGSAFGAAVLLMDWRHLELRRTIIAFILFAAIAGSWFAFVASFSTLGGGGISNDLYVAVTRIESAHWYPVDLGLFWEQHWQRLFPFLAETLLLLVYLPDANGEFRGQKAQMAAGFVVMLVVTVIGICISVWVPDPFLIKLALQRASSIYLLMAVFIIVPGLWQDATNGSVWRAVIATLTFVSCFICTYGVPVAYGLALAAVVIAEDLRRHGWTTRARLFLGTSSAVAVLLLIYTFGGVADWSNQQYWGLTGLSAVRLGIITVLVVFVVLARRWPPLPAIGLFAAIAVLGMLWARSTDSFARQPELLAQADDYLATQLWAQRNTPVGSLFMPDPTHYYGWREFSLRPSFGNLREWLYNAWAYDPQRDVFNEGVARLGSLGLDLNHYLEMRTHRPGDIGDRLSDELRKRYYALSGKDIAVLSRRYGISFFVFDRSLRRSPPQGCAVAYENSHYLIVRAPADL